MTAVAGILDTLALEIPCPLCGCKCRLPLRSVAMARGMLHQGCPVGEEHESEPVVYGPLLDPVLLRELGRVLERLTSQARGAGGRLVCASDDAPAGAHG